MQHSILFLIIPFFLLLAVQPVIVAYADQLPEYNPGDIIHEQTSTREIISVYPDGTHKGILSLGEPPRMLSGYTDDAKPIFINYNFFEDLDHIKFEAWGSSYAFDKNSCELLVYDQGGHINNQQHSKTLSHTMENRIKTELTFGQTPPQIFQHAQRQQQTTIRSYQPNQTTTQKHKQVLLMMLFTILAEGEIWNGHIAQQTTT